MLVPAPERAQHPRGAAAFARECCSHSASRARCARRASVRPTGRAALLRPAALKARRGGAARERLRGAGRARAAIRWSAGRCAAPDRSGPPQPQARERHADQGADEADRYRRRPAAASRGIHGERFRHARIHGARAVRRERGDALPPFALGVTIYRAAGKWPSEQSVPAARSDPRRPHYRREIRAGSTTRSYRDPAHPGARFNDVIELRGRSRGAATAARQRGRALISAIQNVLAGRQRGCSAWPGVCWCSMNSPAPLSTSARRVTQKSRQHAR